MTTNDGDRFDRLPSTPAERTVEHRPTRTAVLEFWDERYGIGPETFENHTFWEKGRGSVWVAAGTEPTPLEIETLGLRLLRTGGRHWKPTTNGVQRFGDAATKNVISLSHEAARRFVHGEDQSVAWNGDWGYLIAATRIGGRRAPLGVGLYTHDELASNVPKSRRVDLE